MIMRTWEDNADEFKALTVQGKSFRLCILVACSAFRGEQGYSSKTSYDALKANLKQFARQANTTDMRIARHYDTWQELAKMGKVPDAASLTPDHVNNVFDDSDDVWAEFNMTQAADEFRSYWSVMLAGLNQKGREFYGLQSRMEIMPPPIVPPTERLHNQFVGIWQMMFHIKNLMHDHKDIDLNVYQEDIDHTRQALDDLVFEYLTGDT